MAVYLGNKRSDLRIVYLVKLFFRRKYSRVTFRFARACEIPPVELSWKIHIFHINLFLFRFCLFCFIFFLFKVVIYLFISLRILKYVYFLFFLKCKLCPFYFLVVTVLVVFLLISSLPVFCILVCRPSWMEDFVSLLFYFLSPPHPRCWGLFLPGPWSPQVRGVPAPQWCLGIWHTHCRWALKGPVWKPRGEAEATFLLLQHHMCLQAAMGSSYSQPPFLICRASLQLRVSSREPSFRKGIPVPVARGDSQPVRSDVTV